MALLTPEKKIVTTILYIYSKIDIKIFGATSLQPEQHECTWQLFLTEGKKEKELFGLILKWDLLHLREEIRV